MFGPDNITEKFVFPGESDNLGLLFTSSTTYFPLTSKCNFSDITTPPFKENDFLFNPELGTISLLVKSVPENLKLYPSPDLLTETVLVNVVAVS